MSTLSESALRDRRHHRIVVSAGRRGPKTVDGFVRYQQARSLSAATIKRRGVALRSFERSLLDRNILEATSVDVEDWLSTLRSAATRAHYRSDLKVFYRWAHRRGFIEKNPVELTDPIRRTRSVPRPLPGSVIATAIAVAEPSTRLAIMLGAYAGLRVSEIADLATEDVGQHVLTVRDGKGGKDRVVPLHPLLAGELHRRPGGWLFPADPGDRHVTAATVRRRISAAFTAIGVTMTAHQLRHSFGTELARVTNGNLLLVAHVLGHDSVVTTQGYTAFAAGPEAAAIGKLWADDEPTGLPALVTSAHPDGPYGQDLRTEQP